MKDKYLDEVTCSTMNTYICALQSVLDEWEFLLKLSVAFPFVHKDEDMHTVYYRLLTEHQSNEIIIEIFNCLSFSNIKK